MREKKTESGDFDPPRFERMEVLSKMDFPLLIIADTKEGDKWVFSWADTDESTQESLLRETQVSVTDTWFAFPVSKHRFKQLMNEEISLREAILFAEYNLHLTKSSRPATDLSKFSEWRKIRHNNIPIDMLPLIDISIKGRKLMPQAKEQDIVIESHLLNKESKKTGVPFELVGPLMDYIQKIFRWGSNYVLKGSPKELLIPEDIGLLRLSSIGAGSIKIIAETDASEKEKRNSIEKTIRHLKSLVERTESEKDVEIFEKLLGKEALLNAYYLLKLLEREKMNLNLKSVSQEEKAYSVTLSLSEAKRIAHILSIYFKKEKTSTGITIRLSDETIEKLNRRVSGQGGWQSLAEDLKAAINREDRTLVLSPKLTERVIRYAQSYGQGGWQERLEPILRELRQLGMIFSDLR